MHQYIEKLGKTLRVRFRQVGRGDTIIIEWVEEEVLVIGIVDCKSDKHGDNAALTFIGFLTDQKIPFVVSFIILSHPHRDHCAGAAQLIEHLYTPQTPSLKKIDGDNLKNEVVSLELQFGTTFYIDENSYRSSAEKLIANSGRKNKRQTMSLLLAEIKLALQNLDKIRKIDDFRINNKSSVDLSSNTVLKCMYPKAGELDAFVNRTGNMSLDDKLRSQHANMLSTVIALCLEDKFILLTSDTKKSAFEQMVSDSTWFSHRQLVGAQIPHHGSNRNFCDEFWELIKRIPDCPAVFSVAPGSSKHPNPDVVKKLEDLTYKIKKTDGPLKRSPFVKKRRRKIIEISSPADMECNDVILEL